MRLGASMACNSAMRKLLRNFPPRMVSRKWTIQLSRELTLPIAAAAPPSAMTVCALPNRDLEMIAVFLPASRASIAARRPAPPAPITTTSYVCRSILVIGGSLVEEAQVGDPVGGNRHDVGVGQHQRAERDPRQLHVLAVQLRHQGPGLVAHRVLREVLQLAADDVPAGVAGRRVGPQQDHVRDQDDVAQAEAEAAALAVERLDRVPGI